MRVVRRSILAGAAALAVATALDAQVMLASNSGSGQRVSLLEQPARLDVSEVSLTVALTRLSSQSGVIVGFSPSMLRTDARTVVCRCMSVTVGEALDRLLNGLPVRYEERDGQVLVVPAAGAPRVDIPVPGLSDPLAARPITTNQRISADSIVAGRVVDATTRAPLADARITVQGGGRTAISDARGEFRLVIGTETATIEITHIGHQRDTRQVRAGETGLIIALTRLAVQLDQMVITGTAGGESIRSQGNAVSRLDVAAVTEIAPPRDVMTVLQTSVPGVAIQSSGGAVGQGGTFRVRGASSLALSSVPLLYIDGIRVNNAQAGGIPTQFGTTAPGGDPRFTPSRLNDINPEDIESIEIVKGPAAATLYGTEASNGVIQITTKRGKQGRPRLEFSTRAGAQWIPDVENTFNTNWYRAANGQLVEVNVLKYSREVGFAQSLYGFCPKPFDKVKNGNCVGSVFSTGGIASFGANLRGGAEQVRYFFSGDYDDEQGSVSYNNQQKLSSRGNISWIPTEKLTVDFGLGYTRSNLQSPGAAGQPVTATINFSCVAPGCEPGSTSGTRLDGPFRGYGAFLLPERLQNDQEAFDQVNRGILNATATFTPFSWLTQKLSAGGDFTLQRLSTLARRQEGNFRNGMALPNGMKTVYDNNVTFTTVDYGATAAFDRGALGSSTSFGAQYFGKRFHNFWSRSENIALNALETIGAGASRSTDEDIVENKSVGMYLQQQVSWNKRLFLTAAMRGDDNSAFGKDFKFVVYPKVSGSWVIGEESWFKVPGVNTAKVRAAWGKAGQQPDAFVAIKTYKARVGETTSGLTTDNLGNPDLKPEVGTEFEGGLDLGLWNDRLGLEMSYYRKTTEDAIVPTSIAPSTGFTGTQLQNLGKVENKGWEVLANLNLLKRDNMVLDLRTAFSRNDNKIVSLGGTPRIPLLFNQFHVPGYPLASFFFRKVVSSTLNNGVATNVMCESGPLIPGTNFSGGGGAPVPCAQAPEIFGGAPLPTWQGSTSLNLSIGNHWQLYGNVEYLGGNYQRNSEIAAAWVTFGNGKAWLEKTDPILMGIAANTFDSRSQWGVVRMGYARLRDIAGTYSFSPALAQKFGMSQGSATLAWSGNLSTFWRSQPTLFGRKVTDPSIRESGLFRAGYPEGLSGNQQDAWPTMQRLTLSVRVVP